LKLVLKDTALEFSWPISRIREAFPESVGLLSSTPTSCSVECSKSIAALVEDLNIPEAKIGLASGVSAFLWLYSSIQGFVSILIHFHYFSSSAVVSFSLVFYECITHLDWLI
jgi:mevalonate kinase